MRNEEPHAIAVHLKQIALPKTDGRDAIPPLLKLRWLAKAYPLVVHYPLFDAFRQDAGFEWLPQKTGYTPSKLVDSCMPQSEACEALEAYVAGELRRVAALPDSPEKDLQLQRLQAKKAALPAIEAYHPIGILMQLRYLIKLYPGLVQHPMFAPFRGEKFFQFLWVAPITEPRKKTLCFSDPVEMIIQKTPPVVVPETAPPAQNSVTPTM